MPLRIAGKDVVTNVVDDLTQIGTESVWESIKLSLQNKGIVSSGQMHTARVKFLSQIAVDKEYESNELLSDFVYRHIQERDQGPLPDNPNDQLFIDVFPRLEGNKSELVKVTHGAQKDIYYHQQRNDIYVSEIKEGKDANNFAEQVKTMKSLNREGFETLKTSDVFDTPWGTRAFLSVKEEAKPVRVLSGVVLNNPNKTKATSQLIQALPKKGENAVEAVGVALKTLEKLRDFIAVEPSRRLRLLSDLQCLVASDGRLIWHDPTPYDEVLQMQAQTKLTDDHLKKLKYLITVLTSMASGGK
jgi:hypothetical protein